MLILKRIAHAAQSPFMREDRVANITRQALDKMQISKVNPEIVLQETAQFYGILVPAADGWEFVHRTIQDFLAAQYWVDTGGFSARMHYEWNTRTAYAACISGDATRVLEGALAAAEGLTCAIETLTNAPDFDNQKVSDALARFYQEQGRVTVFKHTNDGLSASVPQDLFGYLTPRYLNYLVERFARKRSRTLDALTGCCLHELRERKLRLDFLTFEIVKQSFSNMRFQFQISERGFVTPEMARPVVASEP